jgi:hypothetical protein
MLLKKVNNNNASVLLFLLKSKQNKKANYQFNKDNKS